MDWFELAQNKERWDVLLWNGSSWPRIQTGGMCAYGLDRVCSVYGKVGCAVMDWIELDKDKDSWYVWLWNGSSWLRIWKGGMCGYGLDRGG